MFLNAVGNHSSRIAYNVPLLYDVADKNSEIIVVSRSINKNKTIITKA